MIQYVCLSSAIPFISYLWAAGDSIILSWSDQVFFYIQTDTFFLAEK